MGTTTNCWAKLSRLQVGMDQLQKEQNRVAEEGAPAPRRPEPRLWTGWQRTLRGIWRRGWGLFFRMLLEFPVDPSYNGGVTGRRPARFVASRATTRPTRPA